MRLPSAPLVVGVAALVAAVGGALTSADLPGAVERRVVAAAAADLSLGVAGQEDRQDELADRAVLATRTGGRLPE